MHGLRRRQAASAIGSRKRRGPGLLLGLLSLAQLMVILDISAVNVALPTLAQDLGIGESDLGWTITSYSVVFGSLLLLGGRAADLLGRRRVFLTGLGIFTVASLGTAVADGPATLFAARAAQGLGAALLSPAALSILMTTFSSGRERTRALSVWGAVGGAGAAVGVLLGGVLTELADWRAIFFINLPIGAIVGAGVLRFVAGERETPRWRGLDLRGAVLATASFAALVFAASQASTAGWTSTPTLAFGLGGLGGLIAFAALERRTAQPLLRIERLRDRAVAGGFAMMVTGSAVLFGAFLLTSLYLQEVLAMSALQTGLAFLPMAAATGLGAHLAGGLIGHAGVRGPLGGAFALAAAGLLLLAGVDAGGGYVADVLPGMLVAGVGLGVIMVAVATAVLTGARDQETGMLSGLNSTGHEVGGSIGVAVLLTIATAALGASPGSAAALANGLGNAFFAAAVLSAAAGAAALVTLPPAKVFLPRLALAPRVAVH